MNRILVYLKISSNFRLTSYLTQKGPVEASEDKNEDDEEELEEKEVSFETGAPVHRATKVQFAELAG